jgi:hypothetical protein
MENILVDEGSDSTLVTSSSARKLNLQGKMQILEVDGVGGEITRRKSKRVKFILITDDYLNSAPSVDAGVRDCLLNADLKLQRWISNSHEFIRNLTGGDGPSPMPQVHSLSPDTEEKVLGIM